MLTWGSHLKTKRKPLNSRLHILRPLIKFNMYTSNRLLLYKSLLQPIWSYGIALCNTAKLSKTRTIQAFQAICLRMIAKAPWYVTNFALHNDLQITTIKQTAIKYHLRCTYGTLPNFIPILVRTTQPDDSNVNGPEIFSTYIKLNTFITISP